MTDTADPQVPETALVFSFVRSGGPGGQHVNKVATAVQLKVALGRTLLPDPVKARLRKLAGSRITHADELMIFSDRHRSQLRNKEDVLSRWEALLTTARTPPKRRVATKPSHAQKRRRLDNKKKQGRMKKMRGKPPID